MPSGMDVDLKKLKEDLTKVVPKGVRIHGFSEEPVAFGLKALMVVVKVGDIEAELKRSKKNSAKSTVLKAFQWKNWAGCNHPFPYFSGL